LTGAIFLPYLYHRYIKYMGNQMFLKTKPLYSLIALAFSAQGALALCSAPQLETPEDIVIQLRAGVSGNGQSFLGAGSSIGVNSVTARSKGAIYYDTTQDSIVACDGTNWIAIGGGGGGDIDSDTGPTDAAGTYPLSDHAQAYGSATADVQMPSSDVGQFDVSFDVYAEVTMDSRTASGCEVKVRTRSGDHVLGYPMSSKPTFQGSFYAKRQSDGSYAWSATGGGFEAFENVSSITGAPTGVFPFRAYSSSSSSPHKCMVAVSNFKLH
jgi:hypothetical protein